MEETWALLIEKLRQERAGQALSPAARPGPATSADAQTQPEHGTLCLEC